MRGARGLPHGGPCPRPALRRQRHERLARHPAGLVTTETGRCVSNARPGPVRRLLAALPGSRRCRGKRGPHQRRAPAAEARSGRARSSDPRPDGRASDMLSQALREAPWSSPAAPARLAHAGPEHAASHGATRGASAPASVPSETGREGRTGARGTLQSRPWVGPAGSGGRLRGVLMHFSAGRGESGSSAGVCTFPKMSSDQGAERCFPLT